MQKFLSLIIGMAIIYSIIQAKMLPTPSLEGEHPKAERQNNAPNHNIATSTEPEKLELTGNFLEKSISKIVINSLKTEQGRLFFENLLQPQNNLNSKGDHTIEVNRNLVQPLFKIQTLKEGTIGPVTCGHTVNIQYQISDIHDNLIALATKTFLLGSKPILPGIDIVTAGMKVGESRQAVLPPKYAYYSPGYRAANINHDASYKVQIVLNSALPNNFIDSNEVKIFDDKTTYKVPLLCGDKVKLNAKITRLSNNQVLFDSKQTGRNIDMTIGDISYPLIVSYALHGKVPVGTRTVIAKGKTFNTLGSQLNQMLAQDKIPMDEYLMLELTDFKTE
ncbi:FKBP-type peptidyl-prolyl cis-trans isomerase [Candidatus Tisiphia endosymbiont of Nemotelus uliginosus]|uniref:FKBP-type peptidyl-prolyl cis-trans isomerase n=1 Tax=Candidatus Tisiphia endosymbiont of Nemotelus uliginosus TaxID=3077926 RepID=UPI0035C8F7E3